jgi:hypothetical protein
VNGDNELEPINLLLSREELRLVLDSLETDFIPGLDAEPLGELTPEQDGLVLTVAGRALRARELARPDEDGELAFHNALLTMIGVCAYSENVIFAYHWPPDQIIPRRYFGHIRGEDIVAHTRPEDVLHLFSLLPSKAQLIDQVLAACELEQGASSGPFEFSLSGDAFASVRELAGNGEVDKALDLLLGNDTPPETAKAFVATLADSPATSILQAVKQPGDGTVQKRDFTVLQNSRQTWLGIAATGEGQNGLVQIKTTTRDEVQVRLAEWL